METTKNQAAYLRALAESLDVRFDSRTPLEQQIAAHRFIRDRLSAAVPGADARRASDLIDAIKGAAYGPVALLKLLGWGREAAAPYMPSARPATTVELVSFGWSEDGARRYVDGQAQARK